MIDDVLKDASKRMDKSIEALKTDFAKLRTGRAHPSLLDHVHVDYYGSDVPISQAANVTASDSRTLSITPYDKSMVAAIEKAILNSDLGLNPTTAGEVIRIPLPPLNEERRRELIKVVKQEAETARVAVRNIRRDANHTFKEMAKEKDISKDEEHRAEDQIQTLTDKHIATIDKLLAAKEQEMLEI
jgi:ribosome recycling factor